MLTETIKTPSCLLHFNTLVAAANVNVYALFYMETKIFAVGDASLTTALKILIEHDAFKVSSGRLTPLF